MLIAWVVTLAAVLLAGCAIVWALRMVRDSVRDTLKSTEISGDAIGLMSEATRLAADLAARNETLATQLADAERRARRRQSRATLPNPHLSTETSQ